MAPIGERAGARGDFRWSDASESLTITNGSKSDIEFVEIEIQIRALITKISC
jgi:hypothetical protein